MLFQLTISNMRFQLAALIVSTFGITGSFGQIPANSSELSSLFEFNSADEASWQVVNDGVMGGRSKGYVVVEDGRLQFSGTLVTRGGGFTSLRSYSSVDLSGYDGLQLRVRGNGRTFEVEVSDGARYRGRSVSRRAAFETSKEWAVVRVPFSSFRSSIFGQPVNMEPLDLSKIQSFGLYILDGKDGTFELEVNSVQAYRESKK